MDDLIPAGMKCCMKSLEEASIAWWERKGRPQPPEGHYIETTAPEGTIVECTRCAHGMIFRSGNWEWLGADYGRHKARKLGKS